MESVGLSALELSDEMRVELLRRAVSLLAECRDCERAVAYLQDVEERLAAAPDAGIESLPDYSSFLPQS